MPTRKRETIGEYIEDRKRRSPEFAEEFDRLKLARQLRDARERAGLTQGELAARAGTKQPNIARLESGRVVPRLALLQKIARALGRRLDVRLVGARGH